jgi:hypothetical protein
MKTQLSIGPVGLLTLLFVTLKLCGVLAWSWWWVLSPLWLVLLGALAVGVLAGVLVWLGRPRTPQERIAALCGKVSRHYRKS